MRFPRRLWVALWVAVAAAVALMPASARSDGSPTADIVGKLSGPTSGSVGTTLTYTVTATNLGPDSGEVSVWFAMEKSKGLELVDSTPSCPVLETPDQLIVQCGSGGIAVGGTVQLVVHAKVTKVVATTVDGFANPGSGTNDPNTGNNSVSIVVLQSSSAPPPPPPATAPPYTFVEQIPPGEQYRRYSTAVIPCDSTTTTICPNHVELVDGALPQGLSLGGDVGGSIQGVPYQPGTFTFTVEAEPPPGANVTVIRHQYTLVIDPFRDPSAATPPEPVLPNRSLTPGVRNPAVTQATVKTTICVSGWLKTAPPASFMNALKLKQIKQYGEPGGPKLYEEDHLIPLELGGAPRNPRNLWPEPHNQSKHSNPLESALRRKVCAGTLSLAAARAQILEYKRTNG